MIAIGCEERSSEFQVPAISGDSLWLSPGDAERATGWSLKPEGLCKADICVPVPLARRSEFISDRGLDIAAFWRHMGRAVVHDESGETWVLGASARERADALQSLQAPDFELPDSNGRLHRLSDHRGKKVLLVTWASW